MFRLCLVLIGLLLLGTSAPAQGPTPKKYALLVAVTKYEHVHLNQPPMIQYPEADATAIGDVLENSGYQVELLLGEQATKAAIEQSLANLAKKGNAPGVIIIGFFGHGVEYDETTANGEPTSRSYFCPYDCTMRNRLGPDGKPSYIAANKPRIEPDPATLISMGQVFSAMALSPAGNRVLLADCCRNDPHAARGAPRGFGAGVSTGDLPENANTAALFACSKGEQAREDPISKHGAFTKCVLDWFAEPMGRTTAGRLGEHLHEAVPKLVDGLSKGDFSQQPKFLIAGPVDLQLAALTPAKPIPVVPKPMPVLPKPMPTTPPPLADAPRPLTGSLPGAKAGEVRELTLPGGVKMNFVWCPPGTFTMGSPASEKFRKDDENQVEVTLSKGYWLGQTEVTQAQYTAVMGIKPWAEYGNSGYYKMGNNFPASFISHTEAEAFCAKLTEVERQAGHLPAGWKYVLPTEAQWEYACRAGTRTAYSFGDDASQLSEYAWWDSFSNEGNTRTETYAHAVGTKKANPWGLFDMHGNMLEWCEDVYAKKLLGGSNPRNVNTGVTRILRGGSWDDGDSARAASRDANVPNFRSDDSGFRVTRTE